MKLFVRLHVSQMYVLHLNISKEKGFKMAMLYNATTYLYRKTNIPADDQTVQCIKELN